MMKSHRLRVARGSRTVTIHFTNNVPDKVTGARSETEADEARAYAGLVVNGAIPADQLLRHGVDPSRVPEGELRRAVAEQTARVAIPGTDGKLAPAPPLTDWVVRPGDLREGTGRHHVRVKVLSVEGEKARCQRVRAADGKTKVISLKTLREAYRLIERGEAPAT